VLDQHAGRELDDWRLVSGDGPGEDVDLDASLGQELGDFHDIDVETTGIAGARLFERRCVDADGRDSPRVATRHWHTPPRGRNP
jgi:hypothetical protein